MLHDRLVCGINDKTTQRLLLAEAKLTYKKALDIATSQETASKNVQTLRGMQSHVGTSISQVPPVKPVHMLKSGKQPQTPYEQKSKDSGTCYRCGRGGHKAFQCKTLNSYICTLQFESCESIEVTLLDTVDGVVAVPLLVN